MACSGFLMELLNVQVKPRNSVYQEMVVSVSQTVMHGFILEVASLSNAEYILLYV